MKFSGQLSEMLAVMSCIKDDRGTCIGFVINSACLLPIVRTEDNVSRVIEIPKGCYYTISRKDLILTLQNDAYKGCCYVRIGNKMETLGIGKDSSGNLNKIGVLGPRGGIHPLNGLGVYTDISSQDMNYLKGSKSAKEGTAMKRVRSLNGQKKEYSSWLDKKSKEEIIKAVGDISSISKKLGKPFNVLLEDIYKGDCGSYWEEYSGYKLSGNEYKLFSSFISYILGESSARLVKFYEENYKDEDPYYTPDREVRLLFSKIKNSSVYATSLGYMEEPFGYVKYEYSSKVVVDDKLSLNNLDEFKSLAEGLVSFINYLGVDVDAIYFLNTKKEFTGIRDYKIDDIYLGFKKGYAAFRDYSDDGNDQVYSLCVMY